MIDYVHVPINRRVLMPLKDVLSSNLTMYSVNTRVIQTDYLTS